MEVWFVALVILFGDASPWAGRLDPVTIIASTQLECELAMLQTIHDARVAGNAPSFNLCRRAIIQVVAIDEAEAESVSAE